MAVASRHLASEHASFAINRAHRLLIYGASTVWFMAFVLSQQRNYQDAWILDGIFIPFLVCAGLFLWVLAGERDNRVVALVVAWTLFVVEAIPALKYVQPYSNALDAAIHYVVTDTLVNHGQPIARDEVYASIAGMHSWLASLALTGGYTATGAIKFGLPLMSTLMPLMVYWLTRVANVAAGPAKYSIALTILAAYTQFHPGGTGFTLVPLVFLLGVLALREFYPGSAGGKLVLTLIALIGVAQLIFWHSTTPMVLPIMLVAVTLTPILAKLVYSRGGSPAGQVPMTRDASAGRPPERPPLTTRGVGGSPRPATSFLWIAVLVAVSFAAYHVLAHDRLFEVVAGTAARFGSGEEGAANVVPRRLFQITLVDVVRVGLLIQGNDGMMLAVTGLGAFVVWRYRKVWRSTLPFYAFWLLVAGTFAVMIVSAVTGLDYARFLTVPVAVSPFLGGTGLWWLSQKLRSPRAVQPAGRIVWSGGLVVLVAIWLVGFYAFQPMVPKAKAIDPSAADEYVVWIHSVNTAWQQRMLQFAQTNAEPDGRFAVDVTTHRQFLRYFGYDEFYRRRLYQPLHLQEPVDPAKVDYFLLHWPGVSGPLNEQVEWRSASKIREIRNTPGWDLIYDNGQSFVMKVR